MRFGLRHFLLMGVWSEVSGVGVVRGEGLLSRLNVEPVYNT